jgi:hypothetical protein
MDLKVSIYIKFHNLKEYIQNNTFYMEIIFYNLTCEMEILSV